MRCSMGLIKPIGDVVVVVYVCQVGKAGGSNKIVILYGVGA